MAKLRFAQRVSGLLQLPADSMLPVPRLEITGRDGVLITGGAQLLEYSPERIRVARAGCAVTIRGAALRILAMDKMGMEIMGKIADVTFDG